MVTRKMSAILQQLPSGIERAAWAAGVIGETNKLTTCTPESVAGAVYNLAFLGLFPGPALGHAYFVPFRKGKDKVATLVIGYKGYTDLAYGTGFLKDIHADVICKGEEFKFWKDETGPKILHTPELERNTDNQGVVGAYCIYHTHTGGRGIKVIPIRDILAVAKFAQPGDSPTTWDTNFVAMAMKTPVRRAANEWKLTGRLGHALRIEEETDRDAMQSLPDGLVVDGEAIPASTYQLPTE